MAKYHSTSDLIACTVGGVLTATLLTIMFCAWLFEAKMPLSIIQTALVKCETNTGLTEIVGDTTSALWTIRCNNGATFEVRS